jgi:hypothetical protein
LSEASTSIAGRRARVVLALALALLPLVGCRRSPAGTYRKDGLSFDHLAGWKVTHDAQNKARSLYVEGPNEALLTISVFAPKLRVSLETFVEAATKARGDGVKKELTVAGVALGAESDTTAPTPVERTVAGAKARGLEGHFTVKVINVPVPHTVDFLIFTLSDRDLIVMQQVADKNRAGAEIGFQKILDTIAVER